MRTLIIGDSLVGRVSGRNIQLAGGGEVTWRGHGGARIGGLRSMLNFCLKRKRFPTTIVIHLGSNDIFHDSTTNIRGRVEENLNMVRQLFPQTRIIWSDIIFRAFYMGEESKSAGRRCATNINRFAHKVCVSIPNTYFIMHSHVFRSYDQALYAYDGVHLSDEGKELLLANWAGGLSYLNRNPRASSFPPLNIRG
jgi:lysophospholipase L1-like esterase